MICAACTLETIEAPCSACGADTLLDGRYRLDAVLGQGAAGTTFRGVRVADGLAVAVKEMPLRLATTEKGRELLGREARVLRELDHPQIPRHVDDFVVGRGRTAAMVLVVEFVDGVDLAREMERHRYDEAEVLDILEGALPVLAYLHGRSPPVVHRDLKPRNLMRRHDGTLVLVDFGAVRDALVDPALGGSTVVGTFGYMAPEQFQGDASPATDIYGLGALTVALLTRKDPQTMLDAGGALRWRPHAHVSFGVATLIDEMLARDPHHRPRDAGALLARIRRLRSSPEPVVSMAELPEAPRRVKVVERSPNFPPARPFAPPANRAASGIAVASGGLLLLGIAVAVAVVGLVGLLGSAALPPPSATRPTVPAVPVPATCTPSVRDTQVAGPASTSRYQFVGASDDGTRVALVLGRQSDRRAEIVVYEAGASEPVFEHIVPPATVPGAWETLVDGLLGSEAAALRRVGIDPGLRPTSLSWCQSGESVRAADRDWSWETFSERCDLGSRTNTSFQLCPAGAEDRSACVVPPTLRVGCWDDEPRLVDLFRIEDTIWTVAERPHRSTLPRFAAGVTLR